MRIVSYALPANRRFAAGFYGKVPIDVKTKNDKPARDIAIRATACRIVMIEGVGLDCRDTPSVSQDTIVVDIA